MTQYGQLINPNYDPTKNDVYEAFYDYYANPIMTKIKNVEIYSMYMCKIHAMLGNAYRYIIIFVNKDTEEIGYKKYLKDCEWVSLQSRTLEEHHKLPTHTYNIKKTRELNQKIHITKRTEKESTYKCDLFPLTVTMLNTRKNNMYQYQPSGTIVSALETFQTIINFI